MRVTSCSKALTGIGGSPAPRHRTNELSAEIAYEQTRRGIRSRRFVQRHPARGSRAMFRRVATLIAVASATAASGLAAPDAHADPPDPQFLEMVHNNGIGGDANTLLEYARQFCANTTGAQLPARPDLYGQGVRPDQF